VKVRWCLTVDLAERNTLAGILSGSCGARTVEAPPGGEITPGGFIRPAATRSVDSAIALDA
jgi:hypothetical protein